MELYILFHGGCAFLSFPVLVLDVLTYHDTLAVCVMLPAPVKTCIFHAE